MLVRVGRLMSRSAGAGSAASGAEDLLGSETQGLALDFTDDYFYSTTSQYGSAKIIDTGTPANDYDSHPYGKLTYTSPSAKMTLGPSGTLRFGAHNLLTYSEQFDNAAWSKTSATVTADQATSPYSLSADADLLVPSAASAQHFIAQSLGSAQTGAMVLSVVAKASGYNWLGVQCCGGAFTTFDLQNGVVGTAGAGVTASIESLGNGWYKCTAQNTYVSVISNIFVEPNDSQAVWTADGTSGILLARAHVYRAPADTTYLSTTSSARYALPYEWNSSGVLQGILVEEARTNLATYSEDLSAWSNFLATVTTNAVVAPDGQTTADQLSYSGSSALPSRAVSQTISANTTYTRSIFVQKTSGATQFPSMSIEFTGGTGIEAGLILNTNTGVAYNASGWSTVAPANVVVQDFNANWWRVSWSATSGASSTTCNCWISPGVNSTGTNGTRGLITSAPALAFWGNQLEAGSSATSYIPTIGSTVTRAADSGLTIATSAYPHSATVNTAMIRYQPRSVSSAMVALRWDDGTSSEVVSVGHDASANIGLIVTDGGAAQTAPLTSGTATANTWEKIAVSWKANDFLLSDNGAACATDTSGTLPTVTSLDIGPTLTGYISHILVIPVEKEAADVAALATP